MGRDRQSLRVIVVVAVMLLASRHAHGQREDALAHFEQAEAYFRAGAYDKAVEEYQAAFDLVAEPALLFNIGLALENQGDAPRAIEHYQRYLAADPDGVKTAEARARVEALSDRLDTEAAAEAVKVKPKVEETPLPEEPPPPVARRTRRHRRLPGLLVLGGAAVLTGVGVAYRLKATRIRDELAAQLADGTPPVDAMDPRFAAGEGAARRSSLSFGVAGAALAAGVTLVVVW